MNTLADYTSPALILPQLQTKTGADGIAELCAVLDRQDRLRDSTAFYQAVLTREQLSSTCFPPGWAIPHARVEAPLPLSFACGRSSQPLTWFGSGLRVQTVFLVVVPELEAKTYLDLIAGLAKLNRNPAVIQQLQHAPDAESMWRVFEQVSLPNPLEFSRTSARSRSLGRD